MLSTKTALLLSIIILLIMIISSVIIIAITFVLPTHQADRLFENDKCRNSDGIAGVCTRLDNCKTGLAAIKSGKPPKICSFVGDHPVVCCPPQEGATQSSSSNINRPSGGVQPLSNRPTGRSPSEIAKQKCVEYSKSVIVEIDSPVQSVFEDKKEQVDLCARIEQPLVVGGEDAQPREYPHMALIGYRETDIKWLCGGSLISEKFILSAAHCSRPAGAGPARWAKLGELDITTELDDAVPEVFRIIRRIDHPEYSPVTLYNDISLFELEKNVVFGPYIRPICLSTRLPKLLSTAIATGWGHTAWDNNRIILVKNDTKYTKDESEENADQNPKLTYADIRFNNEHQFDLESGSGSSSLMKVKLNIVNNTFCNMKYKNSNNGRAIPEGIKEESMMCAGDEIGKDTCQGDSGGPLQIPIKEPYCMYDLVGLTSFGKACGNGYPGIYSRVSHYLPWIVQNVWPQ